MKWCATTKIWLAAAAGLALLISGCGSSSPNVVTVTVTPSSATAITGQVVNFTATVGGSTTLTVAWTCTYVYTPLATTSNPTPKPTTAASCTSGQTVNGGSIGTWVVSDTNNSNVLTYTAPELSKFPNPAPTVTFTATADANHSKTGTATVGLDSGIRVSISPTTATVPVGITPPQTETFNVSFQNSPPVNVQYKLVQPNPGNTTNTFDQTPNPQADTCTVSSPTTSSPGCGSIDSNGVYTPPIALPTATVPAGSTTTSPTTVFVVAWSAADITQFNIATITLVNATTNPLNFTALYPPTVAAGGLLQDVFLNARNLLTSTQISFVPPTAQANLTPSSGTLLAPTQIFTIPISTSYCTPSASGATPVVTCDASIMTRVRLLTPQLALAEPDAQHPAWIMMPSLPGTLTATSPCVVVSGSSTSTTAIACPLHVVNASPGLVAAIPDVFPQVSTAGTINIGVDGGYFGSSGGLVNLTFNGQSPLGNTGSSGARQFFGTQSNVQLPPPGLYEISVNSNTTQGTPPLYKTATTNASVQPNFAGFSPNPSSLPSPAVCKDPVTGNPLAYTFPSCVPLPGTGNAAPSDIALDSVKQFAVIAEQGAGSIQLVNLAGGFPVPSGLPIPVGTSNSQPTSVALDTQINLTLSGNTGGDLLAVLGNGDGQLYLYGVTPPQFGLAATYLNKSINLNLATLLGLSPSTAGLGTPFSVGIDPGTHLGVVAYSNTGIGSNLGFIVDVNPNLDGLDTHTCFLSGQVPPCVIAPVSVNTGPWPKVVMQPNVPLAYVTPGGGIGTTSVVNLLQQGRSAQIAPFVSGGTSGAVRTAGITKIITQTPHGINSTLGGTVIISGLTTTTSGSNFNGTFPVLSVVDAYSFTYAQTGQPDDTATNVSMNSSGAGLGTVEYGVPYYSFNTSTSASGAAINPITRTFAYADYNSNIAQIGFISTLDQTLSSLTLTAGSCFNSCTPLPSGAPELGFRSVAFDPFVDVLVAYNPSTNTNASFTGNNISLINPGGPAPGGTVNAPYRIIAAIPTGQVGTGGYTPAGGSAAVPVYGPMTYDPKTKYVLVANAGSNTLSYMSLDPSGSFQKVHIQDLQLADQVPAYGVPVVQPPLSTSAPATNPTSCSLTDPTKPCMPQAVRVGQTANLRVLGQGFTSGGGSPVVRLDGQIVLTPSAVTDTEVDVTVPATALFAPHEYALDVQTPAGGATSNSIELHVVGLLDMSAACAPNATFPQGPEGVAVDDSRHVALVTNYACNSVSLIAIDPNGFVKSDGSIAPFGTILATVGVGTNPIGIDVIPRLGYAVVANSGVTPNGTASIINYSAPDNPQILSWTPSGGTSTNAVTVGLSPLGVKIDQDRALAFVANNGSNTLSSIDLTVLQPGAVTSTTPSATTVALSGPPTAIAVDPNRAEAVVTNLQNSGTTTVTGGLDVVTLSGTVPLKSSTTSISSLSASVTGIVYDPGDPNNSTSTTTGVFYATSTQANAIYAFNPDTGSAQTVRVGINPYSLGYNYQTGALLTINSTSNSSSVVDVQNFKTRQTLGISSMSQFAIGVDNFTNLGVIADQNNNRVIFLAMPR